MKNFSTAACAVFSLTLLLPLAAQSAEVLPAAAARCAFRPNAPDQHVVVRRDTLWDISGKFLQHPWCWPQVWGMNREQIRDPHWIYPGQVIYFNRAAGRLQLTPPNATVPPETVQLQPQVRSTPAPAEAIPTVSAEQLAPFLARPLIVTAAQLGNAPVIVATPEGRVHLSRHDIAYVRGALQDTSEFQIFRPGQPLRDPETGELLGHEARFLGTARLQRAAQAADETHRFLITGAREEIGVHDRLLPVLPPGPDNYMPHPPAQPVDARIIAMYDGGTQAGQYQAVSLNRGARHGLDVGSVLLLERRGQVVADVTNAGRPIRLPDEQFGTLFIFRVFDTLAYGLIMQATDPVKAGDIARSPP